MAWNDPVATAKPIVKAIEKFDESSSALAMEMLSLAKSMYWLTWLIAILTVAMLVLTIWMIKLSKTQADSKVVALKKIESTTENVGIPKTRGKP